MPTDLRAEPRSLLRATAPAVSKPRCSLYWPFLVAHARTAADRTADGHPRRRAGCGRASLSRRSKPGKVAGVEPVAPLDGTYRKQRFRSGEARPRELGATRPLKQDAMNDNIQPGWYSASAQPGHRRQRARRHRRGGKVVNSSASTRPPTRSTPAGSCAPRRTRDADRRDPGAGRGAGTAGTEASGLRAATAPRGAGRRGRTSRRRCGRTKSRPAAVERRQPTPD